MSRISGHEQGALATALCNPALAAKMVTLANRVAGIGNTYFVHYTNGLDTNPGDSKTRPLKTLAAAVAKCTANVGDVILLLPGHSEPVASATGAVINVAGITIVGVGNGSLQPTFTLGTATTATISVTAANVAISNIKVVSALADVAVGITAAAGADGLTIEDSLFASGSLILELKVAISLAAACDDVIIRRCTFRTAISDETGAETSAILLVGASDRTQITDCFMVGNFGTSAITGTAAASIGLLIARNMINNIDSTNGLAVSLHASTSGIVAYNALLGLKTNTVPLACAGCAAFENYTSAAVNESGIIRPAVETYA